ncbi:hypothetical protein QVD17_23357 [Tagetes erecta]|uniref:Uncharacterized protein n=1 Tax=Tagetes erecta TaxID=13708 RepID=A0AAD8KEG5_TARER|nr:hypothetical protein QVD17_23357 [Tagetes erecta]
MSETMLVNPTDALPLLCVTEKSIRWLTVLSGNWNRVGGLVLACQHLQSDHRVFVSSQRAKPDSVSVVELSSSASHFLELSGNSAQTTPSSPSLAL